MQNNRPVIDSSEVEKGHGRIETRRCEVFEKGLIVDFEDRWEGLKSVIKIIATWEIGEKKTSEARYYINILNTSQPFSS